MKYGKRLLCLVLSALCLTAMLSACGADTETKPTDNKEAESTAATTEPIPTEPEEEAKILKILTLGSSSSVDSNHMINLVAATEGIGDYEEVVIGTLYYSGCKLSQHVQFLQANSNVYMLYLSSTATPGQPPRTMENVTMYDALKHDYWDIIFLQAAGGEHMHDDIFVDGTINIVRNYVNENKHNPLAIFGWHAIGVSSTDKDLIATYPYTPNGYETSAAKYGYDRHLMLTERTSRLEKYIMSDPTYKYIVASCTAVENAITSYLGQKGIKRDYTHLTDIGRLIASYVWYCELFGIEELTEIKVDAIPKAFLKSTADKTQDLVLTEGEKAVILEAVNNTLKNPLDVTPSQITTDPTK